MTTENFIYNDMNRMLTAKKEETPAGQSAEEISLLTLSNYNSLGAAESINDKYFGDAAGKTSTYDYDQTGNATGVTYPDSSAISMTVDKRGRIDNISRGGNLLVEYDYVGSRVTQRNYYSSSSAKMLYYDIDYDDYGRAERHHSHSFYPDYPFSVTTEITDFDNYTYDKNGNITNVDLVHRGIAPENQYDYDTLNRLTGAGYQVSDVSSDLVAHWKLDESSGTNVNDETGDHDGTLSGGAWDDDGGWIDGELELDGTDDYVDCGSGWDISDFGGVNGTVTIAAWVKPDDVTTYNMITRYFGGVHYFSAGINGSGKLRCMVRDVTNNVNYWPTSIGTIITSHQKNCSPY